MMEGTPAEMFALLRIVQIHAVRGDYDDALESLGRMRVINEQAVFAAAHAGQRLVSAILYNALGDEAHLRLVLELAAQTRQMVADTPLLTRQYEIAVACESAAAHLGLAAGVTDDAARQAHRRQALESSQAALDLYRSLGFVQIIECVSEEILYRHRLALAANGREAEAAEYLQNAYDEMMRKHDLIPPDTPFRRTYLENVPLHRSIRVAYAASSAQVR
jgi:tetratricopeptide (TPR) repeat protein